MNYDFDVAVIGGGAGGLFAASVANALGAKVVLIEKKRLGGDCTWFGCTPSKALLKSAQVASLFKKAQDFGLITKNQLDLDKGGVMSHVRSIIQEISTHHPAEAFEKRGIRVIIGSPQFVDSHTLKVNRENIHSKKFILCTGSHPLVPPIEGLEGRDYLTNESIFDLDILPQSIIVLGGGPIGVELSQALNRLGVKVSIVEMLERILFREDKEVASILEKELKQEGIEILAERKAVRFQREDAKVYVTVEDKNGLRSEVSADNILIAVGRVPNVEGLALQNAGVEYTKKGIKVNVYLQTSNKDIFACGDVAGPYMFSHVASYQAGVCARNCLFRRVAWRKVNYQNIAWATFTDPELAHLGLTEEEAKERYKNVEVYKTNYKDCDRAITDRHKKGLLKVVVDRKGCILGAHIAGADAGEIIQGFLIAKSFKIPLAKLAEVLFIYPTLSELVKKIAAKPLVSKMDNPLIKFVIKIMKRI